MTLACVKEKSAVSLPTSSSSSLGVGSGVRSAAAKLLGGNGSKTLGFVGGNGGSKLLSGTSKVGLSGTSNANGYANNINFDGKGTYLVFNVGDAIFISDLSSQDKVIHCHCDCSFNCLRRVIVSFRGCLDVRFVSDYVNMNFQNWRIICRA